MQQSGEVGTLVKEVIAATDIQAQTVQEVEYRFTPVFADVLKKQEKLVSAANYWLVEFGRVCNVGPLSSLSTLLIWEHTLHF